jgi:Ca2+-transporting ATPase
VKEILEQGLTGAEAAERLKAEGPNDLPSSKPRGLMAMVREVAREPMILLLLVASGVYFSLGDLKEAAMLAVSVLLVLAITLYQEHKTERALEALRDLSSPRALVVRDGTPKRIPGHEVVRGDLLLLKEGDRVPADGVLVTSSHLAVDESLLTGESVPVRKRLGDLSADPSREPRPGGDDLPFVFSGTLIVQGQGAARATATGLRTEMGKIGKILLTVKPEKTRLQEETGRLVRIFASLGLALCALTAVLYGLSRSSAVEGLLVGITLAMSMIPEEIPVVLTVFLALGAWRMSARNVLTRRIAAIETLGAATVLAVDKTGTITQNRMTVEWVYANGEFHDLTRDPEEPLAETFHELGEFALLASQRDPFDPMEKAIHELAARYLAGTEHIHKDWTLIREYPLTPALLALSHVWKSPGGSDYVIAAKGAPEAIFDLCHLEAAEQSRLAAKVQEMAARGLRVLAVAKAYFQKPSLPEIQHAFDFGPVGLLGFADPIRPAVPAAVRECSDAGLRVVMITGDYAGTARHIAGEIGLDVSGGILSGPDLESLPDEELSARVRTTNVYARTVPEQKLRLVEALKANGETVAMTGDGVNDAPALKSAHIGVAMGGRGTDVAREAASIVLVDDDFSSIVDAVRMGRRIFDNLRKAVAYILAVHVPIAGLALLPVLLGWPLVFFPAHIVFLELIIDPACSIAFESEPEERDIMSRPPRARAQPLFGRRLVALSALMGLGAFVACFGVYVFERSLGQPEEILRASTFTALVAANLGLILTNRSWKSSFWTTLRSPNRPFWFIFVGAAGVLALVLTVPALRDLFHFSPLPVRHALFSAAAGFSSIIWFEFLKTMGKTGRT